MAWEGFSEHSFFWADIVRGSEILGVLGDTWARSCCLRLLGRRCYSLLGVVLNYLVWYWLYGSVDNVRTGLLGRSVVNGKLFLSWVLPQPVPFQISVLSLWL